MPNSLPYAKTAMFGSLCFIALYILFNLYMGYKTLLYIVPACMYFGKALCDVLMIINGYHLYKLWSRVIGCSRIIRI